MKVRWCTWHSGHGWLAAAWQPTANKERGAPANPSVTGPAATQDWQPDLTNFLSTSHSSGAWAIRTWRGPTQPIFQLPIWLVGIPVSDTVYPQIKSNPNQVSLCVRPAVHLPSGFLLSSQNSQLLSKPHWAHHSSCYLSLLCLAFCLLPCHMKITPNKVF